MSNLDKGLSVAHTASMQATAMTACKDDEKCEGMGVGRLQHMQTQTPEQQREQKR